jgi:allophanate hydrolase
MLNNIVGLKPSLGLVSTRGVVPACRTLDCVSVFALNVDDAWMALRTIAGYDPTDPYSRERTVAVLSPASTRVRLGVPLISQRLFFGDERAAADYNVALSRLKHMGFRLAEIDMEPFSETAQLLYNGPWLAERYLAARKVLEENPSALHPVTRAIIAPGANLKASDTFAAFYRLAQLRRAADDVFERIDALALPTAPCVYTCEQVLADPIRLNSRLGTYTNFVNLLDLCGAAVPAELHEDGTPFGITFIAPGGQDALAASLAKAFHAACGVAAGAQAKIEPLVAK